MEPGDSGAIANGAMAELVGDLAPFAMLTVDEVGIITWTSGAVERLFAMTPDALNGTNIFDHIDVSWNAEALDSVGYAMTASGLQRPMIFRLIRQDGEKSIVEATANAQHDDPMIGGLAVYIRPWGERWLLDQTLDAIAGNSPLEETLDLLVAVMGAEILEGDGLVRYPDVETGRLRVRSSEALGPHQRGDHPLEGTPWEAAMLTGEPQAFPVTDLSPELATEAAERGHTWCWAWPVQGHDVAGAQGCLVLWRRLDEPPDHTCRASMARLVRLTELLFEHEASAGALRYAAMHDALTGLANRASFFEQLQEALEDPSDNALVGVLYIDLDRFKLINDTRGHGIGDVVLREIGSRLRATVRTEDVVARIGGDEFTVLCPRVVGDSELELMAQRILDAVHLPIEVGDLSVTVGASIGIAVASPGACSIDELIDAADRALYSVKETTKGGWRVGSLNVES